MPSSYFWNIKKRLLYDYNIGSCLFLLIFTLRIQRSCDYAVTYLYVSFEIINLWASVCNDLDVWSSSWYKSICYLVPHYATLTFSIPPHWREAQYSIQAQTTTKLFIVEIDGLMQNGRNPSALAIKLRPFCIKTSLYNIEPRFRIICIGRSRDSQSCIKGYCSGSLEPETFIFRSRLNNQLNMSASISVDISAVS